MFFTCTYIYVCVLRGMYKASSWLRQEYSFGRSLGCTPSMNWKALCSGTEVANSQRKTNYIVNSTNDF